MSADDRQRLVRGAVQELQRLRHLLVEDHEVGDREQDQEREVDEAVHQPGGAVAQQRAHPHAGAERLEPVLGVLRRGLAAVGLAALPVRRPQREQVADGEERDRR